MQTKRRVFYAVGALVHILETKKSRIIYIICHFDEREICHRLQVCRVLLQQVVNGYMEKLSELHTCFRRDDIRTQLIFA